MGETWSVGTEGIIEKNDFRLLRDYTQDLVDKFANAYLSVNLPTAVLSTRTAPQVALGSTSGEGDIRREIDSIARSGQYSPLPDAQMGLAKDTSATTATRIVRNDTAYALHVLMSGPVDRKIDLPPGGSASIVMPPGPYRVAAHVDSTSVHPFYGVQVLQVGIEYTSQFSIK